MADPYDRLTESLIAGDGATVQRLTQELLDAGRSAREILDGAEVMQLINGETLAPLPPSSSGKDAADHTQQVLRPEGGRRVPGLNEGERPAPA